MKYPTIAFCMLAIAFASCKQGGKETASAPFCTDTTCMKEPLKFESKAPGNPFVTINFKDCQIDTIHFEKGGMGVIKDIIFSEFVNKPVKPSKQFLTCDIIEAKHAWVRLNDCATGRGYALKLAFDKDGTTAQYTSALNNFDPKYKVENGLVAYYDNTFIYVHDMATDKIAKQLLTDTGVTEIDFDNPHSLVDSMNVTKTNLYAKLLVKDKVIEHNVPLTFK